MQPFTGRTEWFQVILGSHGRRVESRPGEKSADHELPGPEIEFPVPTGSCRLAAGFEPRYVDRNPRWRASYPFSVQHEIHWSPEAWVLPVMGLEGADKFKVRES